MPSAAKSMGSGFQLLMKSLQAIYRTAVMLGTLVVGALAYRAYGPEIEKLEPVVTRAKQMFAETLNGESSAEESTVAQQPTPPAEFTPPAMLQPITPVMQDPLVENARWDKELQPPEPPPVQQVSPVAVVVRQLGAMGATDYSLTKWGDAGNFYRFRCSLPWTSGTGSSIEFESISENPAAAAQEVLQKIQDWRVANSSANYRR